MRGGPEPVAAMDREPTPAAAAPSGAPETWRVPVEMVLYQTNATGQMFLRRWREKGAVFLRDARVWIVGGRLVAEVSLAAPVGPEKQTALVVQLTPILWENVR